MAYLGNDLQVAFPVYRNIDDISGSFNSSTTSFPLTVSGVAPVPAPLYSQQCLISVAGVVQRPDDSGTEGFRLSGSNIIFASAPATGADFFGVILAGADYINAGANFPSGSAAVPSITFDSDLDTGIYNSGANQVSITTSGTERLRIDSAGQIESVSLGTAAAPAFSFTTDPNTGIYSPGADQVAISTNGTGRLLVTDSKTSISNPGGTASIDVGAGATGNNNALINFIGDTTNTDYGLRIIRQNGGVNGNSYVFHRGTGELGITAIDAAPILFKTTNSERLRITSAGLVGVGVSSPASILHVNQDVSSGNYQSRITLENTDQRTIIGSYWRAGVGQYSIIQATNEAETTPNALALNPSGGNVGIGTTSPGATLHLFDATAASFRIGQASVTYNSYIDSGNYVCGTTTNHPFVFTTNNTERARIDSSGRLLVGTSSARGNYADTPQIQLEGTDNNNSSAQLLRNSNNGGGATLYLGKTRGTSIGGTTVVASGDDIGNIRWVASDGTSLLGVASITASVDGTPGTNDMPGRLVFSTTADGASSPTERMRIAQNGVITIQNGAVAVIGTLTDGATITPDFAADCNFTVTLGGNRTIANPTNITAGQSGSIFIVQDGTGSRTLSWGSYWDFPGGTAPTLSTAANAVDRIDYIVRSSTSIHTVFTANYS